MSAAVRRILRQCACVLAPLPILSGCAIVANRFHVPAEQERAKIHPSGAGQIQSAGDKLSLVTWNIGYAGMGREADFVADGGTQKRPESKKLVERNLVQIASTVEELNADVFLLQEVTRPSWNTYQTDTLAAIEAKLPKHQWTFGADLKTRWMLPPLYIELGNAIFSRCDIGSAERRGLPLEPEFVAGIFRKGYRMHIVRLPRGGQAQGEWVIVNLHLSAFDEGANVRRSQLEAVLRFATAEYAKGNFVVAGGDWNFRLAETAFPHRTAPEHLFWVADFPEDSLPTGWHWAVDSSVPTVRTAHKPYIEGENYVLVIDGFLCSPNVQVSSVSTLNLRFAHTDHHPVRAILETRD